MLDCAGNTESMLRTSHPTVEERVLESFSWVYHETIMAAYGKAAESAWQRGSDAAKLSLRRTHAPVFASLNPFERSRAAPQTA
jgi:Ni,Fe-hydrogenase I small subunit